MDPAAIQAECLEWFRTGELRGSKYGSTAFDVIQALGKPFDTSYEESITFEYEYFSIHFRYTHPNNPFAQYEPVLEEIYINSPAFINYIFGKSHDGPTVKLDDAIKFLKLHDIDFSIRPIPTLSQSVEYVQDLVIRDSILLGFGQMWGIGTRRLYTIEGSFPKERYQEIQVECTYFPKTVEHIDSNDGGSRETIRYLEDTEVPGPLRIEGVSEVVIGRVIRYTFKGDYGETSTKIGAIARSLQRDQDNEIVDCTIKEHIR